MLNVALGRMSSLVVGGCIVWGCSIDLMSSAVCQDSRLSLSRGLEVLWIVIGIVLCHESGILNPDYC